MRSRSILAALAGVAATAAIVPAAAHAATRPIQATDAGGRSYWYKAKVDAQQGDSIEWRLKQAGNPVAAAHDIWLIAPGGSDTSGTQLAFAGLDASATKVLDQVGTYRFYCSVHGGLAPGSMNGTITVGTADPGPVFDPGTPWTDPSTVPDDGPPQFVNPSLAPTVFEIGDLVPPMVDILNIAPMRSGARVRFQTSEAGSAVVSLVLKGRTVASKEVRATGQPQTVKIRTTAVKKLTRLKVRVVAIGPNDLESQADIGWVWVEA